mmetsp:Transcript_34793/g.72959  ORF Transcript_34793/g.72959 Transcript_34793/m.72959 type:complete len:892 (+) Transcript_34793:497-3172(+)|eukprot:CAMPEP_0201171534 /NCGR_PEP_ID=MMETSP0851-20130426/88422_1 /ASSEMBLY_ACC=CAM_ASM_000631 /TAXON_ID=183588 /ORGANISM="Pseudo-nitzschia fraudulenta, Strain WWA7" /LENGTH=891 /DNA_ID=CAMNT_0047453861 /DNA_START=129 /DNA_END=2804 /DNA_ORIENTATION=+
MTTSTIIKSLLLLGLAASQAGSSQAAKPPETTTAGLRAGGNGHEKKEQREHKRQSVIRRLYGPENGEVRKHVRLLEENSERSRTGFLGDIEHEVPYENHPYQKAYHSRKRERRGLQDTEFIETNNNNNAGGEGVTGGVITTTAVGDETGGTDLYRPMRIRFETQALDDTRDASNAAKIDFIKTQILPQTSRFWSDALAVVPVSGNLKISSAELENREYCGDSEFTKVPFEHISTGIPDVDLVLYVSGTPSSRFCRGTTLAVAVACNFDQFDRPTAGAINVCLDRIDLNEDGTASDAIVEDNVDVLKHEVAHVLGHSSNSYRFYWDSETGKERTPRPFESRTVTCVDDVERSLILPGEDTMQFYEGSNGQRYAAIVTPKVRAMARNQFDCQSLPGAKLENQPTGSDSCTGDHWDEHDYYPEALSGVISPTTNIMSHMTLALFEDSGWYRANYTQGRMNPWGLGAGCDFIDGRCVLEDDADGTPTLPDYAKGYFCDDASKRGCSPALTHKLACSVIDYFYIQPQTLPEIRFQYFKDEITMGGPRQADYCPLFGSTYGGLEAEQLACTDIRNADSLNIYSEVYGGDSQCIPTDGGDGRCYRTACVKDEMVLRINVRGEWLVCEYDFQKLDVRVGAGALPQTLVCPRLSTACPDLFCPFNCAGRGVCNYGAVGVNGTAQPRCECFDSSDTSPGCSDSLLQDGDFLDDADGLLDNIEEDFFDPLVAVFVDHPDKWTSASWAWGAGLLTIFLVMLLCICSTFWPENSADAKNKQLAEDYRGANRSSRARSSSASPRKKGSSPRKSQDPRRASSRSRRSSSNSPRKSSSSPTKRSSEGRRKPSSSGARPSSSNQKRSPSSYHERYLRENHQVVGSPKGDYNRSRRHSSRRKPSSMAEM